MAKSNVTLCIVLPVESEECRLNLPALDTKNIGLEESLYFKVFYSKFEEAWFAIMRPSDGEAEVLVESARGKEDALIEFGFRFEDEYCGRWDILVGVNLGVTSIEATRI